MSVISNYHRLRMTKMTLKSLVSVHRYEIKKNPKYSLIGQVTISDWGQFNHNICISLLSSFHCIERKLYVVMESISHKRRVTFASKQTIVYD